MVDSIGIASPVTGHSFKRHDLTLKCKRLSHQIDTIARGGFLIMRKFLALAALTMMFVGVSAEWSFLSEYRPPLPVISSNDTI